MRKKKDVRIMTPARITMLSFIAVFSAVRIAEAQFASPTCVPPNCSPSVIQNIAIGGTTQTASINISGDAKINSSLNLGAGTYVIPASGNHILANVASGGAGANLMNLQVASATRFLVDLLGNLVAIGDADIRGGDVRNTLGALTMTSANNTNVNLVAPGTGNVVLGAGDGLVAGTTTYGNGTITSTSGGITMTAPVNTNITLQTSGTGNVTIPGNTTINGNLSIPSGSLTGSGAALTNLNASQLTSGTVPSGAISGTYSNAVTFSNAANSFTGTHSGDGSALTNLNASNLASGTLPDGRLSGTYTGAVTLSNAANSFTGNGAGLTSLTGANVTGAVANATNATYLGPSTNVTANANGNVTIAAATTLAGENVLYANLTSGPGSLLMLAQAGTPRFQVNNAGSLTVGSVPWARITGAPAFTSGSGTLNYLAKYTATGSTLGNSQVFDNGTNVGIGTAVPNYKLHVGGTSAFTSGAGFGGAVPDANWAIQANSLSASGGGVYSQANIANTTAFNALANTAGSYGVNSQAGNATAVAGNFANSAGGTALQTSGTALLNGNVRVGSAVAPGYPLDVTGNSRISGQLGVNGATPNSIFGIWTQGTYGLYATGTSGGNAVHGDASGTANGVWGYAAGSGVGVWGSAASSIGVYGTGPQGVYGSSSSAGGFGVIGYSSSNSGTAGWFNNGISGDSAALATYQGGVPYAGYFSGNANITGNLTVGGTISAPGMVSGSGTAGYVPRFTGASTLANSTIQDNGSTVAIGNTPAAGALLAVGPTSLSNAIIGTTNAASGVGVYGFGLGASSIGLYGQGQGAGVFGLGAGAGGVGLQGTGQYAGVTGTSSLASGFGVQGTAPAAGVRGVSTGSWGYGVLGEVTGASNAHGVYGTSSSSQPGSAGVAGMNYGSGMGGYFQSSSPTAYTLLAYNGSGGNAFQAQGTSNFTGAVSMNSTLSVTGATTLSSTLSVSGNVGLGTASPVYPLDVNRELGQTPAKFGSIFPVYMANNAPAIGFNLYFNGNWKFGAGSAPAFGGYITLNHSNGDFAFVTTNSGNANAVSTNTERMRITNAGNLGLGTGAPDSKMEIYGSGTTQLKVTGGTGSAVETVVLSENAYGWLGTQTNHPLYIGTGYSGKMYIDTTGRVDVESRMRVGGATDNANFGVSTYGYQSGVYATNQWGSQVWLGYYGAGMYSRGLDSAGRFEDLSDGVNTYISDLGMSLHGTGSISLEAYGNNNLWFQTQHFGTTSTHHMYLGPNTDTGQNESLAMYHDNSSPYPNPSGSKAFRFQWDGSGYGIAWYTSGRDLAEIYPNHEKGLQPGDVVSFDSGHDMRVAKSRGGYEETLMGVVSEKPGLVLGGAEEGTLGSADGVAVALSGRVPVRVSMENGVIRPGDPLTSSATPGTAMKATSSGRVIGFALEGHDGSQGHDGKILVFVNPHSWVKPEEYAELRKTVEDLKAEVEILKKR